MSSNNQFSRPNGLLELILGCMFSGKTSALEKIFKQHLVWREHPQTLHRRVPLIFKRINSEGLDPQNMMLAPTSLPP